VLPAGRVIRGRWRFGCSGGGPAGDRRRPPAGLR